MMPRFSKIHGLLSSALLLPLMATLSFSLSSCEEVGYFEEEKNRYVGGEEDIETSKFVFDIQQKDDDSYYATITGCKDDAMTQYFLPNFVKYKISEEEEISVPVTTIGSNAFSYKRNLKEIRFSENIESISDNAFSNSGLTTIHFNTKVNFVDPTAFDSTTYFTKCKENIYKDVMYLSSGDNPYYFAYQLTTESLSERLAPKILDSLTTRSEITKENLSYLIEIVPGCHFIRNQFLTNFYNQLEPYFNFNEIKLVLAPSVDRIGSDAFKDLSLSEVSFKGGQKQYFDIHFGNYYSNPIYSSSTKYYFNGIREEHNFVLSQENKKLHTYALYPLLYARSLLVLNPELEVEDYSVSFRDHFNGNIYLTKGMNQEATDIISSRYDSIYEGYEESVFYRGIRYHLTKEGFVVSEVEGLHADLLIADSIYDIPVYSIAKNFSADCFSIALGKNVEEVRDKAFSFCYSLRSVHLSSALERITPESFYICANFSEITVDENNPNYSSIDGILYDKKGETLLLAPSGKKTFTAPETLKEIGRDAFYTSQVEEVTLNPGLTTIGDYAFFGCDSLKKVILPNTVTSIGEYSFYACDVLEEFYIPNSVTTIGERACAYCSKLTIYTEFPSFQPGWNATFPLGIASEIIYNYRYYEGEN